MQSSQAKVKTFYESGFPKEVQRSKYDLKLNERLKAARNRKKMSAMRVVKELEKIDVSLGHSTLQGYEAREDSLNHRYPSLPVLMKLAEFYGCSLDYLFGVTDRFKPREISSTEIDIRDVLEGKQPVAFNGRKLKKAEREKLIKKLDMILGKMV